jgi:hypothetical protein
MLSRALILHGPHKDFGTITPPRAFDLNTKKKKRKNIYDGVLLSIVSMSSNDYPVIVSIDFGKDNITYNR